MLPRRRHKDYEAADADVGIDDILEDTVGEVAEEITADGCSYGHATDAIEVAHSHGTGHKAIVGADEGHDDVSTEHIDLGHRHIRVLILRRRDEIKYGGWSLHIEEAAHQSAEHTCANLCRQVRTQVYLPVEEPEIDAEQYEDHSENAPQHDIVDLLQTEYRQCRDHHKGTEYRHDLTPMHIPVHADSNVNGVAHRQKTGQRCSLSIRRHKEREHSHNEYAEAKTRRALNEARDDTQKKYGKNDCH